MVSVRPSSPRYRRAKNPANIHLTDDDVRILWSAYRHRLIDSKSIRALFPDRSEDVLSRRLHKLYHNGYIDRIRQASQFKDGGGSHPLCYALDTAGAAFLQAECGAPISGSRWRQRNRQIRAHNVRHTLLTTNAMVLFEQSAREHPEQELRHFDELLLEFAPHRLEQTTFTKILQPRVAWRDYREREGTAPDQLFSLFNPQAEAGRQHRVICLEIDQGTETVEPTEKVLRNPRSFFKGSSILRKFVVYGHAYEQKTHQQRFGVNAFQVLTITTTPERVELMRQAYLAHLASPPYEMRPMLFLFTDWQTINEHGGRMFEVPVVNGAGKVMELAVPTERKPAP